LILTQSVRRLLCSTTVAILRIGVEARPVRFLKITKWRLSNGFGDK